MALLAGISEEGYKRPQFWSSAVTAIRTLLEAIDRKATTLSADVSTDQRRMLLAADPELQRLALELARESEPQGEMQ